MKKPKAPKLVTVAVTTTITIIFWIFFTLYQVLTTKAPPSIDPELLQPIDASVNTEALSTLKDKVFFEEGNYSIYQGQNGASLNLSPSPTPTVAEEATTTPTPSPSDIEPTENSSG